MKKTDISAEELLLLRLCRLSFSEEQEKKIRELTGTVTDWKYFTFLASEHGIAALVYSNLEKKDLLPEVDKDTVNALRESLMKSLTRNAFHTEVLYDVLRVLNNGNIQIILLKAWRLSLPSTGTPD